jgi:hypothetical protein
MKQSFGAMPTGPREARPDDRLRIEPGISRFRGRADARPGMTGCLGSDFVFDPQIQFSNSQRQFSGNRHCEPAGRAKARPMTGSAKQSISPRKERMDCFASLAMTLLQFQIHVRDLAARCARVVHLSLAQKRNHCTSARANSARVPDAVQRSPGDAKHRPVTLLRRAGTHVGTRTMDPGSALAPASP